MHWKTRSHLGTYSINLKCHDQKATYLKHIHLLSCSAHPTCSFAPHASPMTASPMTAKEVPSCPSTKPTTRLACPPTVNSVVSHSGEPWHWHAVQLRQQALACDVTGRSRHTP